MAEKGTILDCFEVKKGDYKYRGHIVVGSSLTDRVILYSSIPISGCSDGPEEVRLMCPSHFAVCQVPDAREQIDTELMKKWQGARLPYTSSEAKELGAIAFGLPCRTSPYHQAA